MPSRRPVRPLGSARCLLRRLVTAAVCVALVLAGLVTGAAPVQALTAPPTWPASKGSLPITATRVVTGLLDGGMRTACCMGDGSQNEMQPYVFDLAAGATLQNVIIGAPVGHGVICRGSCTLHNVWWLDVGESAGVFRGGPGSVYRVIGGGARHAADKVFQQSGAGSTQITDFYAEDVGKLWRACGNCPGQSTAARTITMTGVYVRTRALAVVGLNANFGDRATIRGLTIAGDPGRKVTVCQKYTGNTTGAEPPKLDARPDGVTCNYGPADVAYR